METEHAVSTPSGWASAIVAQVGSVRLGRQRSPDKHTGQSPVPYLRAANIGMDGLELDDVLTMDFTVAERAVFTLQTGDLVLAEASGSAAHVGRAAIWHDEIEGCCYQNTIIRFRPHAVTPEFALIVIGYHAASGMFARVARGVGILHLGASRFAALPFPVPPLAEQKRIVDAFELRRANLQEAQRSLRSALAHIREQRVEILAAACSGRLVRQAARIAEGEEEESRALDPGVLGHNVRDRGDAPRGKSGRTMPPQRTLFDPIDISGLRQPSRPDVPFFATPEGWTWARIDEVGEVTLGRIREPKRQHGPHMRPYLRVANVHEDRIDTSDVLLMSFTPEEIETYSLRYGDVLLNEGQSPDLVGRPAMYRDEIPGACFQKTLLRFRAGPRVDPSFALLVFRHYLHAGIFRRVARWSTNIAHLTRRRFVEMPFPVPPLEEQRRISEEAARRLGTSADQEAAVRSSLDRLPAMLRELLGAAVKGDLVAQDPNDESADAMLARLGTPAPRVPLSNHELAAAGAPADREPAGVPVRRAPDWQSGDNSIRVSPNVIGSPSPSPPRSDPADPLGLDLAHALRAHGGAMPLPDLYVAARYDRNDTADVERFYLALRAQLDRALRRHGSAPENAEVEAVRDAT